MIDKAGVVHRTDDSKVHVTQARRGYFAGRDRRLERTGEERLRVQVECGLLVEPGQGGLDRAMNGAPVGHDPAPVAPVALQHLVEDEGVFASEVTVYSIIAAHHRAGVATFNR